MKKYKSLIISIIIPLVIGMISIYLTYKNLDIYEQLLLPNYAPPSYVFPIVWTILYVLMGIASYLLYISDDLDKDKVLGIYGIQLFFNFMWYILFFNVQDFLLSTLCLLALWALVLIMVNTFYKINKVAGALLVPYLLWASFALYLNFNIFVLN